ncbi:Hypothetical predicted protein, partial [Pelobates cultripes]
EPDAVTLKVARKSSADLGVLTLLLELAARMRHRKAAAGVECGSLIAVGCSDYLRGS